MLTYALQKSQPFIENQKDSGRGSHIMSQKQPCRTKKKARGKTRQKKYIPNASIVRRN